MGERLEGGKGRVAQAPRTPAHTGSPMQFQEAVGRSGSPHIHPYGEFCHILRDGPDGLARCVASNYEDDADRSV